MKRQALILLSIIACLAATSCAFRTPRDTAAEEASRARIASEIDKTARRTAVSIPGIKVCRQVRAGIAEVDWVKGVVTQVEAEKIRVRIESAGRLVSELNGVPLSAGVLLWDSTGEWVPCA